MSGKKNYFRIITENGCGRKINCKLKGIETMKRAPNNSRLDYPRRFVDDGVQTDENGRGEGKRRARGLGAQPDEEFSLTPNLFTSESSRPLINDIENF